MKLKATTLILGLCLTILAVAASPAYANSTTGFSAFHVEYNYVGQYKSSPYACLIEYWGAVLNDCKFSVNLEFSLPINSLGTKNVNVQDLFNGTDAENTFSCTASVYTGSSASSVAGNTINFTAPLQKLTSSVDVTVGGSSIQLICADVPPGGGIANISWNP
jgi:hypothetical protein